LNIQSYLRAVDRTLEGGEYIAANIGSGLPGRTSAIAAFAGASINLATPQYAATLAHPAQSFGAPVDMRLFSLRGTERTSARIFALAVVNRALSTAEHSVLLEWLDAQSEVVA